MFFRTEDLGLRGTGTAKARLAVDFLLCYQATEIASTKEKGVHLHFKEKCVKKE